MIQLAFKNAEVAAAREELFSKMFSLGIGKVTGGKYSHVELWLDGNIQSARCYSSREPQGTGIEAIDLSDSELWTVFPVSPEPSAELAGQLEGYCLGNIPRRYDGAGILGIGTGIEQIYDPYDRFCSEAIFDALRDVYGLFSDLKDPTDSRVPVDAWMIAPSGRPKNGYGLFELLSGAA